MLNAGVAEGKAGNFNKTLKLYTKSIPLLPQDFLWIAYYNRSVLYEYDLNDYQKALNDINNAIDMHPNNATLYGERGLIYSDLHNKAEAFKNYNKAIDMGSTNYIDYCNRGKEYDAEDEEGKAIEDFKKCLELKPDLIPGHLRIIDALLNSKRFVEARSYITKFSNLTPPNDPIGYQIYYLLDEGELNYLEKKYEQAIPFFENAFDLYKQRLQKGEATEDFYRISNGYYGLITSYEMTDQYKMGLKRSYELLELAKKNHDEKVIKGAKEDASYFENILKGK